MAVTSRPSESVARAVVLVQDGKLTGPAPLVAGQDPWAARVQGLLDIKEGDPVFVLATPVPSQYRYHRTYARADGKRCVTVTEQMPDAIEAAIQYAKEPANGFDLQHGGYQVRVYGRRATATDGPVAAWIPRVPSQGTTARARRQPSGNLTLALIQLYLDWEVRDPGKGFPEFDAQAVLLAASDSDFAAPVVPATAEKWAGTVFDACFASVVNGVAPAADDFQGMLALRGSAKASAPSWTSTPSYPGANVRTRKGSGGCSVELTGPMVDQDRITAVWRRRALAMNPAKVRAVGVGPSTYTIKAKRANGRAKTVKLVIEPRYADSFYAITIGG